MSLKLRVKLGNVSNLSDARYAAGMGVESIGFDLSESNAARLSPESVKEITDWVVGVDIVGELGLSPASYAAGYPTNYLEFSEGELLPDEQFNVLRIPTNGLGMPELESKLKLYSDRVKYFIISIEEPDLAEVGQVLKALAKEYPIFIHTDFTPYNVHYLLEVVRPQGIELKGGQEDKPGFKDYDEIAEILELLEED